MADKSDTIDNGTDEVAELRRQLDGYKARAETAETVAARERTGRIAAERQHMSAAQQSVVNALDACEGTLASLSSEADTLEERIGELADQPGNGKEIAKLNRRLSEIVADSRENERKRDYLKAQTEKFEKGGNGQQQTRTDGADDRKLANGAPLSAFPPKTQAFLERHPEAFTNPKYMAKAIAAAQEATAFEGLTDESDEYFEFVEAKLSGKAAPAATAEDDGEGDEIVTQAVTKPQHSAAGKGSMQQTSAVAPPTRQATVGTGTQRQRGAITLTPEEKEVAESLYGNMPAADAYVKYAEGRSYMKTRNPGHFQTRH